MLGGGDYILSNSFIVLFFHLPNWCPWGLVSLGIGVLGDWYPWGLVSLGIGILGDWYPWGLHRTFHCFLVWFVVLVGIATVCL